MLIEDRDRAKEPKTGKQKYFLTFCKAMKDEPEGEKLRQAVLEKCDHYRFAVEPYDKIISAQNIALMYISASTGVISLGGKLNSTEINNLLWAKLPYQTNCNDFCEFSSRKKSFGFLSLQGLLRYTAMAGFYLAS